MEELTAAPGSGNLTADRPLSVDDLLKGRPDKEKQLLEKAADWAHSAHREQLRASGEPYYSHVLAVAGILSGLKLDYETLAAAMLHDVVEDTRLTLDDVRTEFGTVIARLVDGVTKMERIAGDG
jgi:(p)ppGpp synthase/HD superfamily hydrolase